MGYTVQGAILLLIVFGVMILYAAKAGDSWDGFIFSLKALGLLISVLAFVAGIIVLLYMTIYPHHPKV